MLNMNFVAPVKDSNPQKLQSANSGIAEEFKMGALVGDEADGIMSVMK